MVSIKKEILEKAKKVRLLGIDVDGVMTDGSIIYSVGATGRSPIQETKNFYVRDGAGVFFAHKAGIIVAFITVRGSKILERRAEELEVTELHQGVNRKWDCIQSLLQKYNLKKEEVGYIGDDLVDVPVLKRIGFPVAVGDAVKEVKKISAYTTQSLGGKGAVREAIEVILKAKGVWEDVLEEYYREIE